MQENKRTIRNLLIIQLALGLLFVELTLNALGSFKEEPKGYVHVDFPSNELEEVETSSVIKVDNTFQAIVNATWRLETGNGTSYAWTHLNNAGGIKCGIRYCVYETKQEGLNKLETLLTEYYDKFGTDFKGMRDRYCQCGGNDYNEFVAIYNEEKERLDNEN